MQFSAPEPDVRVQRINILLVNKNSVDTYAFFGSLKQKYFACSACRTQADQVSVNCMRCRVFFLVFSLFFPLCSFLQDKQGFSLIGNELQNRVFSFIIVDFQIGHEPENRAFSSKIVNF